MSHSLHRFGTPENLKNDFCIYSRAAKGVNRDNCGDKLRRTLSVYLGNNVVNFGSSHAGRSYISGLNPQEYAETLDHSYGIIATFASGDDVKGVLTELKAAALGISVVVSGLIEEVKHIASEAGLKPHTALLSLGIYGKASLLPEKEVLEVTTMCGHSLVGAELARTVIDRVKRNRLTPERGAKVLARPCPCGIFNTSRCAELLAKLKADGQSARPQTAP